MDFGIKSQFKYHELRFTDIGNNIYISVYRSVIGMGILKSR